ncbi:unnamed protein product [Rotaria sordida]|uniref:Uncharacterized protein n=1 Tax=Rotaria sordida TaxID=392033 RepID=A0A814HZU9_9BILA|nr:unnamed protein product [Rotaria sordida]CAF1016212.1 unnamed protein product [Rotaria sordida]CAF1125027.1 unnamed protein product [Rotaria sordida]
MSFKCERFLIDAIEQYNLHKIITCVKHGHNVNIKNNLGQNLLIHVLKQQNYQDPSFEKKRLHIFKFLITHCNLDVHITDYYNKNLFNWITNLNRTHEGLYLLRSYPGDIDILQRDHSGSCSLHYAIEHGNEILVHAIVNYLLQYNIRFDIKDNYNNTPEELARKLGYNQLANYLSETCRLTIFISREISFLQQRPITTRLKTAATTINRSKVTTATTINRSKTTTARITNTKTNLSILSSLISSPLIFSSPEFYNLFESKIEQAKNLNDWKTVAALRTFQKNLNEKNINKLPIPTLQINRTTTTTSPIPPTSFPITTSSSISQSAQLLNLLEPQICSSYRQPFIPNYPRPIIPILSRQPPPVAQRKMSITSSRRMSSVMGNRKRNSNASQLGILPIQDGQNRLVLPSTIKQRRQSITSDRSTNNSPSQTLHTKNTIAVHD